MTARRTSSPWAAIALACVASVVSCAAAPPRTGPAAGAGRSVPDENALRSHPPAPEPAVRFTLPAPYVASLPNGMRLVVLERHTLRIVAAVLVIRGGTAGLSHEPPAAARVMVDNMMSGTRQQNELQIYQGMNQNLIEVAPHLYDDWLGVNLRTLSWHFDEALTMVRDVVLEPTFPPYAIDVVRGRLIGYETATVEPFTAAERNLVTALYGLGHPYSVALASLSHDLQRLGRDDVVSAWRDLTDPAEATLVVAGDVDPLVVRQSVATLFGGWAHDPARRPPAAIPAPEPAAGSARIVAVDRPGARQATILYGGRLAEDSAARFVARELIEELLQQAQARSKTSAAGGEPGATWSARQHYPAAFWWQKTTGPDQVGSAIRELDGWMGGLRDRGPDAGDLKAARARVTRRLPRAFETVEKVADLYGGVVAGGMPLDWVDEILASAEGLTWGEIRRELLTPEQTRVVVVGNLAALMDQLLSLGRGAVEIHDVDGRLLRTVRPPS